MRKGDPEKCKVTQRPWSTCARQAPGTLSGNDVKNRVHDGASATGTHCADAASSSPNARHSDDLICPLKNCSLADSDTWARTPVASGKLACKAKALAWGAMRFSLRRKLREC